MQASDRLFYFYQTLLDCHSALEQLGSEAEQAQTEAQKHLQVTLAPSLPLLSCWQQSCRACSSLPSHRISVCNSVDGSCQV